MLNLLLCHWSSQLFDLRAPSSTDVPVLLLNQPTDLQGVLVVDIDLIIILNSIFPTENDNDTLASSKGLLFDPFN